MFQSFGTARVYLTQKIITKFCMQHKNNKRRLHRHTITTTKPLIMRQTQAPNVVIWNRTVNPNSSILKRFKSIENFAQTSAAGWFVQRFA